MIDIVDTILKKSSSHSLTKHANIVINNVIEKIIDEIIIRVKNTLTMIYYFLVMDKII
jgi:hypothetical protein